MSRANSEKVAEALPRPQSDRFWRYDAVVSSPCVTSPPLLMSAESTCWIDPALYGPDPIARRDTSEQNVGSLFW